MDPRIVACCALVLIAAACAPTLRPSVPASDVPGLVGTWRAVEYWDRGSADVPKGFPYGERPCGYVIYTSTGHVSVQLAAGPVPPRLPADSVRDGVPIDAAEALSMLRHNISYFGAYTVDSARGMVVHHIEAEAGRTITDTHAARPFRLRGDTLILGNALTWRRLLVREMPGSGPNPACAQRTR